MKNKSLCWIAVLLWFLPSFALAEPPPEFPSGMAAYVLTNDEHISGLSFEDQPRHLYADSARKSRIQGDVILRLDISVDGRIVNVTPVKGLPMGLLERAIEAAWKFQLDLGGGASQDEPSPESTFSLFVTFPFRLDERATPKLEFLQAAEYPREAYENGIEGDVTLALRIGEEGNVVRVNVADTRENDAATLPNELLEEAIRAAEQWRFAPPERPNETFMATISFRLDQPGHN